MKSPRTYLIASLLLIVTARLALAQTDGLPVETVIQTAHTAPVVSIGFSKDGKWMVSHGGTTAIIWEVASARQIRRFEGIQFPSSNRKVSLSPGGKYLIYPESNPLNSSQKTKIYEVATGKMVHSFNARTVTVAPGEKLVAALSRTNVTLWDIQSVSPGKVQVKQTRTLKDIISSQGNISFSADGNYMAFRDNTESGASVWNVSAGQKIKSFKGKNILYRTVEFTTDGKHLVLVWYKVGRKPKIKIEIREASNWTVTRTLKDYPTEPTLTFGPDSRYLITSNFSKDFTKMESFIWDITTGKKVRSIEAGFGAGFTTIGPSGTVVISEPITTSTNFDIIFRSISTWEVTQVFEGAHHLAASMLIDPDANNFTIISGEQSSQWDLATSKIISSTGKISEPGADPENPISEDRTPDGKISALGYGAVDGSSNARIVVQEIPSGKEIFKSEGVPGAAYVKLISNGEYIVSMVTKQLSMVGPIPILSTNLKVHEVLSGKELMVLNVAESVIFNFTISPDELYLMTYHQQWKGFGTLNFKMEIKSNLWEVSTGKHIRSITAPEFNMPAASPIFSPDGANIAAIVSRGLSTGRIEYGVIIWETVSGKNITFIPTTDETPGKATLAIEFSPDGKHLAASSNFGDVDLYSVTGGGLVKSFLTGSGMGIVKFSADGEHIFVTSGSRLSVFSIRTGKSILDMHAISSTDWIATTPDGYFDVTEGAKQYIHFVRGTEIYELDQFFEDFYTPGLFAQVMGGGKLALPKVDIAEKLNEFPPPTVEIISPRPSDKLTSKTVEVQVKVTDTGGGIDEVKLLHNGKRVGGDTRGMKRKEAGDTITRSYQITLVQGTNEFIASAFSTGRIESRGYRLEVLYAGAAKTATSYLLAVGINTYKNSRLNLNYARADASAFVELVAGKSKQLFQNVIVTTLYDTEATRPAVLAALDDIAGKAGPEDVFTFYYAGHGSMVENSYYFVTTENVRLYDREKLDANAIPARMLQEKFARIKALKQLIVMDACQSGAATELLAVRGAAEEKALAQLARSAGVHVLASAGTEQFATEFAELGHGAFTYVLLEALKGGADGAPKDGKVTIYELKSYLDDQVPELTAKHKGQAQYPNTFSKGQDFPVVME